MNRRGQILSRIDLDKWPHAPFPYPIAPLLPTLKKKYDLSTTLP